jgi:tryptophan synthase beta chain
VAWVLNHAAEIPKGSQVVVCLSGRGDKDLGIIEAHEAKLGGAK